MTPLAASISDATIWSITFDDTRSIDYDHNSFIIQATSFWSKTPHGLLCGPSSRRFSDEEKRAYSLGTKHPHPSSFPSSWAETFGAAAPLEASWGRGRGRLPRCSFRKDWPEKDQSGNPYWTGRLGTVDLLINIGYFIKNIHSVWFKLVSTRRPIVLILSLQ